MAECKSKGNSSCSSEVSEFNTTIDINMNCPQSHSESVAVPCKNRIDGDNKMWVPIKNVNEHIICGICHGYLYEATTITECMHSFCKSCIIKHLERSLKCPTCLTIIHPTDPFVHMRLDRLLQDIVYGLLPSLAEEEFAKENKFYTENAGQIQSSFPSHYRPGMHHAARSEGLRPQVNLSLNCKCSSPLQKRLERKFVRVTGDATIKHVALLIKRKLLLPEEHAVELYGTCSDGCVSLEFANTLSTVKAMHFEEEEFVHLEYEIRPWDWLV